MGIDVRIRNGMTTASEGDVDGLDNDIISTMGVVDKVAGHALVHETSPLDMKVQIDPGIVYVANSVFNPFDSDTKRFYAVVIRDNSTHILPIGSNSSGSTRIDLVCAKMDIVTLPDGTASNVGSVVIVPGTPGAGVPATPTNHTKLAEVTVANGTSQITNSIITDTRAQAKIATKFIDESQFLTADGVATLTNKTYDTPVIKKWSGWQLITDSWSYSSIDGPTSVATVPSGAALLYSEGMKIMLTQSRAYTNDPASGSNIALSMAVTQGFKVGDVVTVSSSAGSEQATITVVTTNTSITVNSLSINHTNVNPLVTAVKRFFVTKVADTALTLYGGTKYELANDAISSIYFSTERAPLGFSLNPDDWTEIFRDTTQRTQASPTQNQWYNLNTNKITLPIGVWVTSYRCALSGLDSAATTVDCRGTLSTGNNTESNTDFTTHVQINGASATLVCELTVYSMPVIVAVTTKTDYFFNIQTEQTGIADVIEVNQKSPLIIKAVCAYL